MDLIITSETNDPADFTCRFTEPFNLEGDYEMCVKSVYLAPEFNYTSDNNSFSIMKQSEAGTESEQREKFDFAIPAGHYSNVCEVLAAMSETIWTAYISGKRPTLSLADMPTFLFQNGRVKLSFDHKKLRRGKSPYFLIDKKLSHEANVYYAIGYCPARTPEYLEQLDLPNELFINTKSECFMYSTVVKNSRIDNTMSRLLCTLPVNNTRGYSFYEFKNLTYRQLSVHTFDEISFQLANIEGHTLQLDHLYLVRQGYRRITLPTIIHLHIRPVSL